jgi:nitrogen fixation NifU-like protein
MITEMVIGKTLEEALSISKEAVADALGGLPPNKNHCSNLGADALHKAIEDYRSRQS